MLARAAPVIVGRHLEPGGSRRLGPVPLTLHDRPSEVVRDETLRSRIRLGPFDFDETYTLGAPLARSTVRASLAAIRAHCTAAAPERAG